MCDIVGGTAELWIRLDAPFARYEVSDLGRVRNRETGHVLRGSSVGNYKQVLLRTPNCKKYVYVHRLVAKAFLGLPESPDLQVHHKNHNPSDNRLVNLQRCSGPENAQLKRPAVSTDNRSRPVIQKTMDGVIVVCHSRITQIGYDPSTIVKACKGKIESAYGFRWEYADEKPLEGEEWKELNLADSGPIGVSSKGRVKLPSGKITYGSRNDRGYKTSALKIDGKKKTIRVHRLVAMAFCPLPDGCNDFDNFEIDHLNCNRADNAADNLEWVSSEENLRRAGRIRREGPWNGPRKPVRAIPPDGVPSREFSSILEASNSLSISRKCIAKIADGKQKSTRSGFRFEYPEPK